MVLIFHIIIAIASLAVTGFTYMRPSQKALNAAYSLVAITLMTGFYLVLSKPASMTQTCITGLIYLGVITYGIVRARNKLASIKTRN